MLTYFIQPHSNTCNILHNADGLSHQLQRSRLRLKCDGTRAETRFHLLAKWTSPVKLGGGSVQSTAGGQGVCISGSNAGYTMFRGSVKSTGYPLHSPVSPSLLLPCVTVCHHWTLGYLTTAVVCFMYILFKDAFSNPDSVVSVGTMSWEGCGRKMSSRLGYFPETPDMTEENHEVSRCLVYEQNFVSGIYRIRGGSVST